ncbi:hypothetical protein [Aneurinibacillus sp. REN35]|uniref:hypothetical protein n=1 Tax=Aneurinibacillus sp. REN35 TaxID=3237286 RepID=UPI0035270DF9
MLMLTYSRSGVVGKSGDGTVIYNSDTFEEPPRSGDEKEINGQTYQVVQVEQRADFTFRVLLQEKGEQESITRLKNDK